VQFNPEDIAEFQDIWKQVFGEAISEAEARDCGNRLVEFFLILAEHHKSST
jgi:hypothetical protein